MEFRHLPVAGGIYDQNPDMMIRFRYLFRKLNEEREREEAERNRKSGNPRNPRALRKGASRPSH